MKKWIIAAVIVLVTVIVLASSLYTVKENQHACIFRFSEIIGTKSQAGLYFKIPFVDQVKYFSKATMFYDIPPSEAITADQKNMTVDCYVIWNISEPKKFYQTLGTAGEAEVRLNAITYTAVKNAMGKLEQDQIINMEDGAERNKIYESITTAVDQDAQTYGIRVQDVKIKRFDLPESNLNATYNSMITDRNQMAEKFTADGNYNASVIRNEVDKTVNITISNAEAQAAALEAEGEAEYMRLLAEAFDTDDKRAFYEFTLALDALKKSLTGSEKTIILDKDSELAKILTGN